MENRADASRRLRQSWRANADAWTRAVREGRIESRRVATDGAALEAVLERSAGPVLDLGCGEGWLARGLASRGITVVGVDASEALIDAARGLGGAEYHVLSYAELAADPARLGRQFGAIVCNFSLLEENLDPLLRGLNGLLAPDGVLIIQTVHPWTACGDAPYEDAWREETFTGFGGAFSEPMPWYFRTLGSWVDLVGTCGFRVVSLREPTHPERGTPLSLLMVCAPGRQGAAGAVEPREAGASAR